MDRFTYEDVERERAEIARETPHRRHRVLIDLRAKVGERTEPRYPTPEDDDETRRALYRARLRETARLLGEDNVPPPFAPPSRPAEPNTEGPRRRPRGGQKHRLAREGTG